MRTRSSLRMHEWINCALSLCVLQPVDFAEPWRVWSTVFVLFFVTTIYYHDTAASSAGLESNILHVLLSWHDKNEQGRVKWLCKFYQNFAPCISWEQEEEHRSVGLGVGNVFLSTRSPPPPAHVLPSAATGGDLTPRWLQRAAATGSPATITVSMWFEQVHVHLYSTVSLIPGSMHHGSNSSVLCAVQTQPRGLERRPCNMVHRQTSRAGEHLHRLCIFLPYFFGLPLTNT